MEKLIITNPVLMVTVSGKIYPSKPIAGVVATFYDNIKSTTLFVFEVKSNLQEVELERRLVEIVNFLSASFKVIKHEYYKDGATINKPAIKLQQQ